MSSFFKALWFGKPQPDNVMQTFLQDIDMMKESMETLKNTFTTYGRAVVSLGHAGANLGFQISKFNEEMRPKHNPIEVFVGGQNTFARELQDRWHVQFMDDVVYMFDHWKRQSEAQKNTIANYEIARQHCFHLKSRVSEFHDQRNKALERGRPISDALARDIEDAELQFKKYSLALENMRIAIITNQNKLTGSAGQFVYFDKAFYALLDQQVLLAREMRRLVSSYEPVILESRNNMRDSANSEEKSEEAANRRLFEAEERVREIAEFVYDTSVDRHEMLGGQMDDMDQILHEFKAVTVPSAPATPSHGGPSSFWSPNVGKKGGSSASPAGSVASTGVSSPAAPGVGSLSLDNLAMDDALLNSPRSPFRLQSARKKRQSWGMGASQSAFSPAASTGTAPTREEDAFSTPAKFSGHAPTHDGPEPSILPSELALSRDLQVYLAPLVEEEEDDLIAARGSVDGGVWRDSRSNSAVSIQSAKSTPGGVGASASTGVGASEEESEEDVLINGVTLRQARTMQNTAQAWTLPPPTTDDMPAVALHDAADASMHPLLQYFCPERLVRDAELRAWEYDGQTRQPLKTLLCTLHVVMPREVGWRALSVDKITKAGAVWAAAQKALSLLRKDAEKGMAAVKALVEAGEVSVGGLEWDCFLPESWEDGNVLKVTTYMRITQALSRALITEWEKYEREFMEEIRNMRLSQHVSVKQKQVMAALDEAAKELHDDVLP